MKIGIGNDHVAVAYKNEISEYMTEKGYEVINYGTDSEERFDYPIAGKQWLKQSVQKQSIEVL